MLFHVYGPDDCIQSTPNKDCSLQLIRGDDEGFQTLYMLRYHLGTNTIPLGHVKIGYRGQAFGVPLSPGPFSRLDERFFSLGQSDSYYEALVNRGDFLRRQILEALHDVAYDLYHFTRYRQEEVMERSLLRSVTEFSVQHQFHRIAQGGITLCDYSFSYTIPRDPDHPEFGENCLQFQVTPYDSPPSNIHVLIGRNGAGKTSMIKDMVRSICGHQDTRGVFRYDTNTNSAATFANVVYVAFSPFDDFSQLDHVSATPPCTHVGLDKTSSDLIKSIEENFNYYFSRCMVSPRKRELWLRAIHILEKGDPGFADANMQELAGSFFGVKVHADHVMKTFSALSSGHKVVLLTITSCVHLVEERTILFFDEPENHLHPPLLAALVRALSDLLMQRNGVAIISTHSPVVLQEVPDICVWKLNRVNQNLSAYRPSIQTFGATIGALTNEVFGLEFQKSGFYNLLREDAAQFRSYEAVYEHYHGRLGQAADMLLRSILHSQRREEVT